MIPFIRTKIAFYRCVPGLTREDIERSLTADLTVARERLGIAKKNFTVVVESLPTDLPNDDGTFHLQLVEEYQLALRDWLDTLTRFNDFVVRGVIPLDLL